VTATEHFADALTSMACAATPVTDGAGEMVGVIDLTCAAGDFSPLLLPFAKRAARDIGHRFRQGVKGEPVLVLGTTDNTTITAAQVIVSPPATSGSNPGGKTIGYTKGKQGSTAKVGTIPSDYTQGSGTLASGTTADKATEAALTAYPGGVVDRVVELSNGDYEVHVIGVNWPHHIFVNQDFQVIGADD
jgi:hypothetical protein